MMAADTLEELIHEIETTEKCTLSPYSRARIAECLRNREQATEAVRGQLRVAHAGLMEAQRMCREMFHPSMRNADKLYEAMKQWEFGADANTGDGLSADHWQTSETRKAMRAAPAPDALAIAEARLREIAELCVGALGRDEPQLTITGRVQLALQERDKRIAELGKANRVLQETANIAHARVEEVVNARADDSAAPAPAPGGYKTIRDHMGKVAREAWLAYCRETQAHFDIYEPSAWEAASDWSREAYRREAEAVANALTPISDAACAEKLEEARNMVRSMLPDYGGYAILRERIKQAIAKWDAERQGNPFEAAWREVETHRLGCPNCDVGLYCPTEARLIRALPYFAG